MLHCVMKAHQQTLKPVLSWLSISALSCMKSVFGSRLHTSHNFFCFCFFWGGWGGQARAWQCKKTLNLYAIERLHKKVDSWDHMQSCSYKTAPILFFSFPFYPRKPRNTLHFFFLKLSTWVSEFECKPILACFIATTSVTFKARTNLLNAQIHVQKQRMCTFTMIFFLSRWGWASTSIWTVD